MVITRNSIFSKIKKLYLYVKNEIHHGNFLPAILVVAAIWWGYTSLWKPTIDYFNDRFSTAVQGSSEVAVHMYKLQQEIEELKRRNEQTVIKEPYGVEMTGEFGISYEEWRRGVN